MSKSFTLDKAVFNISKDTLNYLTGKVSLYKTKVITIDKCSNCDLLKLSKSNKTDINEYCQSYCNRKDVKSYYIFTRNIHNYKLRKLKPAKFTGGLKSKKSINFIKSELSLVNYRFSELQIKQALLYYYLSNSEGIINGVEKKKLAEALNCTVKTVENNNKVFLKHNLFDIKRDCAGSIYVRIKDYHLQYQEGGTGYMPFTTSILKRILNTDDLKVNEIRFLLKALVKFDFNYKKKHKTKFLFSEIKKFLANNFHNVKSLSKLIQILNNQFKELLNISIVKNNEITIDIANEVHGKFVKETALAKNKAMIRKLMYENDFLVKSKSYLDNLKSDKKVQIESGILHNLGELSIEYGYDLVANQLLNLGNEEMGSIDNFGGFIRSKITENINNNRAYFKLI